MSDNKVSVIKANTSKATSSRNVIKKTTRRRNVRDNDVTSQTVYSDIASLAFGVDEVPDGEVLI